jgi:single-strand DNA-binding protein
MLNINRVMLTGRLTRDPETKYLPSGMAITSLAIAVNRRFQDKNGEWRDETSFIDIETFGKTAERLAETLRKGQAVYVEGRLKQDTWERDGVKQSKIRVSADSVKGFDVPTRGQGQNQGMDHGDSEGYGSAPSQGGGGYSQSQQSRSGGAPSDGLHFDGGSNVSDDVPF